MSSAKERLDPWIEDVGGIQAFLHIQRYEFAMKEVSGMILDVGCGFGYGSKLLSAVSDSVVASDISSSALAYARSNYNGPIHVKSDVQRLPFKNAVFDGIVALEIIEHVDNGIQLLRELNRVLRNKGTLILSTPNAAHLGNRLRSLFRRNSVVKKPENPYHKHEYPYKDIEESLESTGFVIENKWGQMVTFPFVHKLPPRLCATTGRNLPGLSYHVVFKARKTTVIH